MYSYVFVTNPNIAEGLGGDMMRGGPEPRFVVLVLHSTLAGSQTNRGGVYAPPSVFFFNQKTENCQHHCQAALPDNVAGDRPRARIYA